MTLWASAFAGIRAGLHSYSPESVALLRYLVASAALGIYALITKMPLPARKDVPGIASTGFLGFAFYNVALNAGEQQIPAGTASLIVATAPIFVALMARIFFHEHLKAISWIGILISFVGVGVISIQSQGRVPAFLRGIDRAGSGAGPIDLHGGAKTFPQKIFSAAVYGLCDLDRDDLSAGIFTRSDRTGSDGDA